MKCASCDQEINIAGVAEVEESPKGTVDLQIRCKNCGCNHFTYIAVSDLVDDAEKTP
jgi:DNA-directed RNA polymerase subunit RPC12/RpoP